jgi:signal transduction histidine kinase
LAGGGVTVDAADYLLLTLNRLGRMAATGVMLPFGRLCFNLGANAGDLWFAKLPLDTHPPHGRVVLRHALRDRLESRLRNTPETVATFEMFADVIGFQLSAIDRLNSSETSLLVERKDAALREQLIAVLSHDLRNPLAAIDGGLRLLFEQPQTDKAKTIIGVAQDSVTRMARLIDDVMDFARGRLGGGIPCATAVGAAPSAPGRGTSNERTRSHNRGCVRTA